MIEDAKNIIAGVPPVGRTAMMSVQSQIPGIDHYTVRRCRTVPRTGLVFEAYVETGRIAVIRYKVLSRYLRPGWTTDRAIGAATHFVAKAAQEACRIARAEQLGERCKRFAGDIATRTALREEVNQTGRPYTFLKMTSEDITFWMEWFDRWDETPQEDKDAWEALNKIERVT